jgi:putative ABC transport system permease protein
MSAGEMWRRFLFFRHRARMTGELQEEMRLHIALRARKLREQGVGDRDAHYAAERQFGNKTLLEEVSIEMWGWISVERFFQDVRFAVRSLRKNLAFSAVTVATFALGIGVNTAIFSVVNAVLLRPLPYPESSQIVHMSLLWKSGDLNDTLTVPQFEFYRDHNSAFQAIAGFRGGSTVSMKQGETLQWIASARVTDGFFSVLGVQPAIGRGIERGETRPGGPPAAVLTDSIWRTAFGADPAAIGRQIEIDDVLYTVVGVMPAGFSFIEQPADVFLPLQLGRSISDTGMNTRVIARLKPGTSVAQAQANINLVFEHFRQAGLAQSGQRGVQLENYQKWLAGDFRTSILMLFGAVGLLLLIACANIASLFMARASARQREISVRFALGARRSRLFQQFLAESLLIALLGGIAGLVAAHWALKALVASIPWHNPLLARVGLDARVLAFTFLLAAATSFVFGFASCWQISALDLNAALKESTLRGWAGAARNRARSILVVGEIALSLMLSVSAGLLIESIFRLHQQKLGFDPRNVYTMTTPFGSATKLTPDQIWNFEQEALQRIRAIPGVVSAATVNKLPLTGPANLPTEHEGYPEHSIGGMEYRAVSSEYFQTMHIPVLQGRAFQETDTASSTPVAIISESVAHAWWNGKNPIGDRVVVGEYRGRQFPEVLEQPRQVVGVVADVKNLAIDEANPTTVYVPAPQLSRAPDSTAWVVRATGNPSMGSALRKAVLAVRPDQRVLNLQSMSDLVAHSVARPTFNASLMSTFAALALALTSVGIYGLLNFQVARRTQEIGIRMALGAKRSRVLLLIAQQAAVLAIIGITVGVVGAVILARFLSSLLTGIHATDPLTYIAVSMLLLGVALAASYAPARRASNVDPLVALRYE